jgi:hypothetical protein
MSAVPREELLERLRWIRDHGLDAQRFIRSARADGDIDAGTAAWLSSKL